MKNQIIFLDNRYVKGGAALREKLAPWHLPGVGLFETMRIYRGDVVLVEGHIARLLRGLATLKVKHRFTEKKIGSLLIETVRKNGLACGRMRLCVWHDGKVHISVMVGDYKVFTEAKYQKGFSAKSFKMGQNEKALTTGLKTIHYGPFLDCYHLAQNLGFDESILCDNKGRVVESSRANIFWVNRGVLYTPALETGCLNGITRNAVFTLSQEEGLSIRAVMARLDQLKKSEESFLTNSLMDIMPLTKIDEANLAGGRAGPLTLRLRSLYRKKILEKAP